MPFDAPGLYEGTLDWRAPHENGARRVRINVAIDRGFGHSDGLVHMLDDETGPHLSSVTQAGPHTWRLVSMPSERRFRGTVVASNVSQDDNTVAGSLIARGQVMGEWSLNRVEPAHPAAIAEAFLGMVLSAASPRLAEDALGDPLLAGKIACLVLHSTRDDGDMGRLMAVLATLSLGSRRIMPVVESWKMPFGLCCTIRCSLESWPMRAGMLMRDLPCMLFLGRAAEGGQAIEHQLASDPTLVRKTLYINLEHSCIHTWRAKQQWPIHELATAVRHIIDGQPRPRRDEVIASQALSMGLLLRSRESEGAKAPTPPGVAPGDALMQLLEAMNALPPLRHLLAVARCARRVEELLDGDALASAVNDRAAVKDAVARAADYALGCSVSSASLKEVHARARDARKNAASKFNNNHVSARVAACAALCARAAMRMLLGADLEDDLPRAVQAGFAAIRDTRRLLRELALDIDGLETGATASVGSDPLWREGKPPGWPRDFICHDAFVSYSHVQRESFTRSFCTELKASGWHPWWDDAELRGGSRLSESIDRGVALAKYAILILSRQYFLSKWTMQELRQIQAASAAGTLKILPILIDILPDDLHGLGLGHLADLIAYVGQEPRAAALHIMQAMRGTD